MPENRGACIVLDIVGSRQLPDRIDAQRRFERGMSAAGKNLAVEEFIAVQGDGAIAVFSTISDALDAVRIVREHSGLDIRFGIGVGEYDRGAPGYLAIGAAWDRARQAIVNVKALEQSSALPLRGWVLATGDDALTAALVNARLLREARKEKNHGRV